MKLFDKFPQMVPVIFSSKVAGPYRICLFYMGFKFN